MQTRICRLHGQNDIRIETEEVPDPGNEEALVAIAFGGICGSDLHYYQDGGFGSIRVREPIILGHEAAGTVLKIGAGVTNIAEGDRVAINPSRPCNHCKYCLEGLFTHCLEMRFNGSAMRFPHEQGLFRERIVVPATQCLPLDPQVSLSEAACSEPLAVCLHARRMAGDLAGKRVLVTGAGPIGVLCAALAAEASASEVVVTDLQDFPLKVADEMGATRVVNVAQDPDAMSEYAADKGYFDVVFECTAAPPAIRSAIEALRPQGKFVQVGVTGDVPLPLNLLVSKEITYQGTQRFHEEFSEAVQMITARNIDLRPIISANYPLDDAVAAFSAAADRRRAVKVHLAFADTV